MFVVVAVFVVVAAVAVDLAVAVVVAVVVARRTMLAIFCGQSGHEQSHPLPPADRRIIASKI